MGRGTQDLVSKEVGVEHHIGTRSVSQKYLASKENSFYFYKNDFSKVIKGVESLGPQKFQKYNGVNHIIIVGRRDETISFCVYL